MSDPGAEFKIRQATEDDVPAIRKAIRSSIEGLAGKDYPKEVLESWGSDTENARKKQRAAIREGKELTWVAIENQQVVGFSAFCPETEQLRAVYVALQVARRGVGTALLEIVEDQARRLNLAKLTMHSSLTAVPFYERHGYSKLYEEVHILSTGVKMKAVAMTKALR